MEGGVKVGAVFALVKGKRSPAGSGTSQPRFIATARRRLPGKASESRRPQHQEISPAEDIADDASYSEDLGLDSLTLLEIGVDMDYEFKLGLPEERLQHIRSVQDAYEVVMETLGQRQVAA